MKYLLTILAALTVLVGCTPNPRYRSGSAEAPPDRVAASETRTGYSTSDLLRLGSIMRSFLGKPYAGSSRYEEGVDCSGFVQEVFRQFDRSIYLPRTVADQVTQGFEVSRRSLAYGDLVFFNTVGLRVSHVGIYTGHNEFIHASSSQGVMISSLAENYWSKRFVTARRILGKPTAAKR